MQNDEELDSKKAVVSKMQFFANEKMNYDHVRLIFGQACAGKLDEELRPYLKKLERQKEECLNWGKTEIEKIIMFRAVSLNLKDDTGFPIETFKNLQKYWQNAANYRSESMFATIIDQLYFCCIGWSESHPNWQEEMEKKYLLKKGWIYDPATMYIGSKARAKDTSGRGCIARVMSEAKKNRTPQF